MKHLLLSLIIAFSTTAALAHGHEHGLLSDFKEKGLEVLYASRDKVKLDGDAKPGEKLEPLFQDFADLIGQAFSSIMSMGDDDDDAAVKLKDALPNCEKLAGNADLARCTLNLDYKSGEKVEVLYYVNLNHDVPVSVYQDKATIHRK